VLTLPGAIATAPHALPGLRAAAAVLCLGAVGTALAFVIFYKLMVEVGPARASLVAYLAPGVALLYGALLLGERVTPAAIGGLALILAGVAVASRRPAAQPFRKRWTAARFAAGSTSTADSPSGS
jgi:drug/metabolite transporter (DMT)-like permease